MALFGNESDKNNHSETQVKPMPTATQTPAADHTTATSPGNPAYLDRGTKITGKLHFDGPAKIDGQVEGEIRGKEIIIGESAVVTAQITAESVVVCGRVDGEIVANKRIEIRPSAKVAGNVTTPVLVIQEGAHFEGHCAMAKGSEDRKAGAHHNGAQPETRAVA